MSSSENPSKGSLLIAKPFLGDPNFERGVILLCEYNTQGCFGFVLNQVTDLFLGDVLEDTIYQDIPLHLGGPVEKNTLHFIHRRPDLIQGGAKIMPDVFWGGDFEQVRTLLNVNKLTADDVRFFIGYSGWSGGQLENEITQDSWIVTQTSSDFLFTTPPADFWREILKNMGGEYRSIAHYPTDPRLN
ncbi:YqgE/AlgH family protein [Dyadobacter sp. LHD-138]|uniref:YqgE/AlgH family protein n=1 Tax=Dyadobacter sp. LHD-138 TaxID=3071413 RepID=UPI0027DFE3A3|nr:YqgE/AlgH family protein [Dyadobacter sp. LHD-138]MDQ6477771.1 YqgE/AlgH family protein [Dyadobacter sp. LHD-138]